MFDVGWQELFLIAVVALVVIGPKDLPMAMRGLARFYAKVRGMSREFQSSVSELMREAELDELRRKFNEAGRADIGKVVKNAVDPTGSLSADFDPAEFARDLKRRVEGDPSGAKNSQADDADHEDENDIVYGPPLPPGATRPSSEAPLMTESPTVGDDDTPKTRADAAAPASQQTRGGESGSSGERK